MSFPLRRGSSVWDTSSTRLANRTKAWKSAESPQGNGTETPDFAESWTYREEEEDVNAW